MTRELLCAHCVMAVLSRLPSRQPIYVTFLDAEGEEARRDVKPEMEDLRAALARDEAQIWQQAGGELPCFGDSIYHGQLLCWWHLMTAPALAAGGRGNRRWPQ